MFAELAHRILGVVPASRRQQAAGVEPLGAADILEGWTEPVILCTLDGSAVHLNRAAMKLMERDQRVEVRGGIVRVQVKVGGICVPELLGRAGRWCVEQTVAVPADARRSALLLKAIPAGRRHCLLSVRPLVPPEAPPEGLLRQAFGLTAAEARLARLLVDGVRLAEAASQLGISVHTARTQLRHIFGKTQTGRQSDLARLLCAACVPAG